MNFRRFFHVLAIMFSSLVSMVSHGHAEPVAAKKQKKPGEGEMSKPHRRVSGNQNPMTENGDDDPPRKLDPALMMAAQRPSMFNPMPTVSFPQSAPVYNGTPSVSVAHGIENTRYPWRQKIVTTTFWVGEIPTKNNPVPNTASSWDPVWSASYGGFDNPDVTARKDFMPVNFVPHQNPFYVALPYNDMEKGRHKAEASQVVPWFKQAYEAPDKSVCKGRWIAIRFNNKVVYAQWEDCGPFRTDHWEYVFGNERPKPNLNHGAGLDVSPAVRDYLGMNDTDVTDWRFVDFDEVPEGPWSLHGENNTFVINKRRSEEQLRQARMQTPGSGAY